MADIQSNINVNIDTSEALASIKVLQRQISAFYTSMARSGAAANAAVSNMQNNLINTINQTGKFSASVRTVASSTEAFTTSLEKNKFSLGQYFRYAAGASKTFGKSFLTEMQTIDKVARERVKTLQTQYISMGRDASGALKAIAVRPLTLDLKDLGTQTAIAAQKQQILNQLLKQGSTNLLNFGKNTQWAGRQLMVGFTIPLSMVGTAAAKTFMKMEEQAIKFKRVYGDSMTPTAETDAMIKQIRDLATEFTKYGVAAEKTMELAATAAAAGKQGADLTGQVREANRLAVLGQVEQQDALNTTISITNAFGTATQELAKKIDFLNAVENQTVTSIEDLTIAVPKAGPVVKQLGGDVEDLAFFLTAMREGGINASEGANALKSGLAALINPTGKASEMLAGFGINVKNIVESNRGDVKGLVLDFASALDTLDPLSRARAIEQLFGKFQFSRLSTLFQNVIKDGTQASRVLDLTTQSSSQLAALASKELGTVAASSMFKFQKSVEELKIALAPIGEIFLKLVTPIIEFGTKVLENFNKLDSGAKNFIVGLIAVVGGLGPVLLMTFGLLANGVANIIKGFMLVRRVFTGSAQDTKYLGDQTDYMTQQQLEATGVAASLEQVHQKLEQRFTSEATAVNALSQALERAVRAQVAFQGTGGAGRPATPKKYAKGVVSVPGPKGAGDIVPAMLAPGEAVIPAKQSAKYAALIQGIVADNIPGYRKSNVQGTRTSGMVSIGGVDIPVSGSQAQQDQILSIIENAVGSVMSKLGVDIAPRLTDILSNEKNLTVDRLKQIVDNFDNNIIRHAEALTEEMIIEAAHGNAPKIVSAEQQRKMGAAFYASNPNATHRTMLNAKEEKPFHSELVFGMPKQFNQPHLGMSGEASAEFVRKFPQAVMARLAKFGNLDPNDPGLMDFAMKMADRLEAAGTKVVSESQFYEIVSDTLGDDIDAVARSIIERAERTFLTIQQKNEGSSRTRRQVIGQPIKGSDRSQPRTTFTDEDGNVFGGGTAYTQDRDIFRSADSQAFAFVKEKIEQLARQAGFVVGTAMETGASQGLNEIIQRNSLPKEAIKIGRDYGFALNGALRDMIPKAKVAGEAFGIAATTGMTTVTPAMRQHLQENAGRILRPFLDAQGRLIPIASQKVVVLDEEAKAARRAADAIRQHNIALAQEANQEITSAGAVGMGTAAEVADDMQDLSRTVPQVETGFSKFGSALRNGSFVLTSLAAAGTMAGGDIGEMSAKVMQFSGIIFAATTVIDLLVAAQNRQIAAQAMQTKGTIAATAAQGVQTKTGFLSAIMNFLSFSRGGAAAKMVGGLGFLKSLKNAVAPLSVAFKAAGGGLRGFFNALRFVIPVVLGAVRTIASFIPVVGWIVAGITGLVLIVNAVNDAKERERLATEGVSDAMINTKDELDALANALGKEKLVSAIDRVGTGGAAQKAQVATTTAETLAADESFLDKYKKDIDQMRTMSQRELKGYQDTLAIRLQASGQYTEEEIQGVIMALQQKAERTDVKLDFASIDITSKDPKAFQRVVDRFSGNAKDSQSSTLNQTQKTEAINIATAGYYETLLATSTALTTGVINLEQYNSRVAVLKKSLDSLGEVAKTKIVNGMLKEFVESMPESQKELGKLAASVEGSNNQLFVMESLTSGSITTLTQLKEVIEALNIVAAGVGNGITQAQYDAAKITIDRVTASTTALNKETADYFKQTNAGTTGGQKSIFQQAVEDLQGNIKSIKEASKAYNLLSKAGFSAADAFTLAQNPALAAALATTKVGTDKWKQLVELAKEFVSITKGKTLSDTLTSLSGQEVRLTKFEKLSKYLSQMGLSSEEVSAVLQDEALADSLIQASEKGKKGFEDIDKFISSKLKNIELRIKIFPEEYVKEGVQKAMDAFSAKENVLELEFKIKTKADQDLIREQQAIVSGLNFQADDYEAGLTRLEDGESAINEKYDNRIEALDKIISANDRIADQNKEELNIFQMVARGDISGAAAGIAQLQQQRAKNALEAKKESLQAQRTNELESLTAEVVVNGQKTRMTRNQIEENLKNIKEQIFNIEENSIEPAQNRIDLEQQQLEKITASLTIVGQTKDQWQLVSGKIDLAKTSTIAYLAELENALKVAKELQTVLDGGAPSVKPEDFPGVKTGDKTGKYGLGGKPLPEPDPKPDPKPESAKTFAIPTTPQGSSPYGDVFASGAGTTQYNPLRPAQVTARNSRNKAVIPKNAWFRMPYGNYYLGRTIQEDGSTIIEYGTEPNQINRKMSGSLQRNETGLDGRHVTENWRNFAVGGKIKGPGTGTSDSIPALLSNGEYVIRANAVKALGTDTLDRMNYADKNRFADGGSVDRRDTAMANRGGAKPKPKAKSSSNPIVSMAAEAFRSFSDPLHNIKTSVESMVGSGTKVASGQGDALDYLNLASLLPIGKPLAAISKFAKPVMDKIKYAVNPEGSKESNLVGLTRLITGNRRGVFGSSGPDFYESQAVRDFIRSNPNVGVRVPEGNLLDLINSKDKRYKSIFESGRSNLGDSIADRAYVEKQMFGLSETMDPSKRPVYGFMYNQEKFLPTPQKKSLFTKLTGKPETFESRRNVRRGFSYRHATDTTNTDLDRYGNITLVLKKQNIKDRTTFTYGDSYNNRSGKYPTPARMGTRNSQAIKNSYNTRVRKEFVEAQIMGGFTLNDVKKIIATDPKTIAMIQDALKAQNLNIPVGLPEFTKLQKLKQMFMPKPAPKVAPADDDLDFFLQKLGYADGGLVDRRDLAMANRNKSKPKKKIKFGLEEIASGLTNPVIQGAAYGTDVLGGMDIANSLINIGTGKGGFLDYLSAASILPIGKPAAAISKGAKALGGTADAFKIFKNPPNSGFRFNQYEQLGMNPGGFRKIDGSQYYVKRVDSAPQASGEVIASELYAAMGNTGARLNMFGEKTIGSKIIPNLISTDDYNLGEWVASQANKKAAGSQLMAALKEYAEKDVPFNALIGNSDTHAENILFNTQTGKLVNLDLGMSVLSGHRGSDLFGSIALDDMARIKGDVIGGLEEHLPKSEITKLLKQYGMGESKSPLVLSGHDVSPTIDKMASIMGFDLKDSNALKNITALNNKFIKNILDTNPELAGTLSLSGRSNFYSNATLDESLQQLFINMKEAKKNPFTFYADGGLVDKRDSATAQRKAAAKNIINKTIPTDVANKASSREFGNAGSAKTNYWVDKGLMSQDSLNALRSDIAKNGIKEPLMFDTVKGKLVLLNGHHRLAIANELGIKNIPATGNLSAIRPAASRGLGVLGLLPMLMQAGEIATGKFVDPMFTKGKTMTYAMGGMVMRSPEAPPKQMSMGGMVAPKYFANGGMVMPKYFAKGGDVIPAMLTPGEFVVNKHAVEDYGVNNLRAINSGTAPGNSVYNGYNINVNVKSNSNPDQIANAVMTQIRQVNAQQVRGNRF